MNIDEQLCELVAYNGSLQIAHWRADTKSNEHNALGGLYESMVELTDTFAENYMGKYGVVGFKPCDLEELSNVPSRGLEIVESLQKQFKAGSDDDLLNVLADMSGALNKAAYLLKTQPEAESDTEEENDTEEEKEESKPKVFDTEGMDD